LNGIKAGRCAGFFFGCRMRVSQDDSVSIASLMTLILPQCPDSFCKEVWGFVKAAEERSAGRIIGHVPELQTNG